MTEVSSHNNKNTIGEVFILFLFFASKKSGIHCLKDILDIHRLRRKAKQSSKHYKIKPNP